ncbi:NAD-dependent succinate-semialdehyde dehydrogenase [Leifsonia shinshuensis]|uniref:Succinate-semialdehyde dehydrogenase/glutarate-semialdehyde dehydrogenase n=1 Tax=Leifsonia shinshuensis TaxID=150026 RepID=A0A853CTN4_9MICO|nr:NAD-dependent succinate-semialdehyde dehydrogenase [Leifsonia shinshuensis]NYJ22811.1 succinate-semialdehyde dehydrogenase/glutarate-semialdehyde dehydrogenase [Leifsonia shinshuensis]
MSAPAFAVVDPATGETVRVYETISDDRLGEAVAAADDAHRAWRRIPLAERAAVVRRVAGLHRERRRELAAIAALEMGKPIGQALAEVDFSADIYAYYADNAERFLADEPLELRSGGGRAFVRRASLGALLGIMPWNFPYYQVARFAAPNVVAGNTILLKHAPQCPESAAAIEELFAEAGAPAGVYTNVYASTDQVAGLIADPRVQGVSLTGSERAGAAVAALAGRHLKKVVLELGGSDPFLLLSTDDLAAAVDAAVAARLDNNGQTCNAAKRFIVADELYDAFAAELAARFRGIVPSSPQHPDTVLGPLSSAAATELLEAQLDRAEAQGARVLVRGERDGNFFPPAVLAEVGPAMDAYAAEFFGPVAQLHRAASEEDAVRIANDTPYGLGAYVFTTDPEQALRVADRLDAGMIWVNLVQGDAPELPFGGVKRSGFGRELGRFGAEEFVNRKLIRIG